jgi:hypothetical protein
MCIRAASMGINGVWGQDFMAGKGVRFTILDHVGGIMKCELYHAI